ncbi:MAG: type IV pilin-like G/H family protein [Geitlerinemataceae cyanobacterium]
MKRQLLGILAFSIALNSATAVSAANPDHLRQLLQTQNCPDCDLTNADLRRLDLPEADLNGANLGGADLSYADLTRANLSSANLAAVKLKGTNLTGANLANANLTNAMSGDACEPTYTDLDLFLDNLEDLDGYSAGRVYLWDPDFFWCGSDLLELNEIVEIDFCSAVAPALGRYNDLVSCQDFSSRIFDEIRVGRARTIVRGADLSGANLSGADLKGIDLRAATLTGTRLSGTNLSYALLFDAELPEASPATWKGAFVTAADVEAFVGELIAADVMKARESEGKSFVGAINRAQQAYKLENEKFATTIEETGVGLPPETENYRMEIVPQPDPTRSVMVTATAKQEGISSYMGAVFIVNDSTFSIICETNEPSQTPPEMPAPPTSANDRPQCLAGSSAL